ncbi:MAG: DUF2029 domain-containing protein [Chloroflexi bacterium]|nr:DUF2029 domain-containing protein [Chloroflexota bacterium]
MATRDAGQADDGMASKARLGVTPIRGSIRLRALRDALVLLGLGILGIWFLVIAPQHRDVGRDAYAYWSIDQAHPYDLPVGSIGAFNYPPPMVRLFAPLALVSWPVFLWFWLAIQVATVIWLGWRRSLLVLAFPPVAIELYYGNINLLLAAAVALGFRYPATWAFVLLTKVTPGVGLLWFAVRREWRALARWPSSPGVRGPIDPGPCRSRQPWARRSSSRQRSAAWSRS